MANYEEQGRTNAVLIKSSARKELDVIAAIAGIEIQEQKDGCAAFFMPDGLGEVYELPDGRLVGDAYEYDAEEAATDPRFEGYDPEKCEKIDPLEAIAYLMEPGEVLVYIATGAQKLAYLTGYGIAYNHFGNYEVVDLNKLVQEAAQRLAPAGKKVSLPESPHI